MKSVEKLPSRYRIDGKLGEGGFGEVYKAYDSHLDQTLAIKILPDNTALVQETLTREFKTLSQLQHPNLVRVFDYGTLPPSTPYFTMELVEGESLRDFLRDRENVPSIPLIIRQVLKALAYLHGNRILHGDIKPENIVITEDKDRTIETKLLDFGLAMSLGEERKLMSGTLRYLAPEILLHGMPNSPATDLYALGVSLIESILSTEVPGPNQIGEAFFERMNGDLTGTFAGAGIRNPSALSSFILDLCRLDPSDRARDAREATRFFELIADELGPRRELRMDGIFVGRNKELAEIEVCLKDAIPAKRVVLLFGPRGIGKKSIVRKAAQRAQVKGYLSIDLTPGSSYFALDRFIDALGSSLSAKEKKRLISGLPAQAKAGGKSTDAGLDPNMAPVIYAHIIQFLGEISVSQPILIIVSDIERSSRDLLAFMTQLIRQLELADSRINVIMTSSVEPSNPAGISAELNRILRSPLATTIQVPPFDDRLMKQYLIKCFGTPLLPEKERRDILSKTQGIPLLISAFLKSLIANLVIQDQEGHWILDRRLYKQKQIPTDIDDSLSAVMRDLPEDQEALARLLALYGQASRPEELRALSSGIIENPPATTDGLLEKTILVDRGDGTVSFAHPIYAQFIIDNMPSPVRKDFSDHLAHYLVSDGSTDSLRIAQLYISAEKVNEALQYGFDAIEKMYSSYMLYDCLKLLLDLKDLASRKGSKPQLLSVLERLAPIEHSAGLPREAIEDYAPLVATARRDSEKARYYMQLADVHYGLLGNMRESRELLQRALRAAKKAGNSNLIANILYEFAFQHVEKSIPYLEEAAAQSRNTDSDLYLISLAHLAYRYQIAGNPSKASRIQRTIIRQMNNASLKGKSGIYAGLYLASFYAANYRDARRYIMKKIQIDSKTEDSLKLVSSMSSLGGCFYTEGSFYNMINTLKDAYFTAIQQTNYLSGITILSNLSLGYRSIADYGQSLKMFLQAEEMIKREGIQAWNSAFLNKPTMLYAMLGAARETEFKSSARRLFERATKTNNRIGLGHHSMAFAIYHMNRLEFDDALIHAKKALALFRKADDKDDAVSALVHVAVIQLSQGKLKPATAGLRQAEEIYDAIHCEYLKPILMLGTSMLARLAHSDDAKKTLADALRTSRKMGTRETTWQIQREYALYHKERGELHKALAFYKDALETIKQITETINEEELRLSYLQVPFRRRVFDEIKNLK
jgi:serine/threonine protein kinase